MRFMPVIPALAIYLLLAALVAFAIRCLLKPQLRQARIFRKIAIGALLLLALARPVVTTGTSERSLSNLNVFFVIDNTGSMVAKDAVLDGKVVRRYEAVKADMETIAETLPGAKYGIIVMDYSIYQVMPLISDVNTFHSFVDSLEPRDSTASSSSTIGSLLTYSYDHIKKYNERFPDRNSLLVLMTDGEEEYGTKVPDKLKTELAGGAVIGYGTQAGTKIESVRRLEDFGNTSILDNTFIKNPKTGQEVVSKLDETNLQDIAKNLAVSYYAHDGSENAIKKSSSFTNTSINYQRSGEQIGSYTDLYWLIMIAAIALLLWDFSTILDSLLLERKVAK